MYVVTFMKDLKNSIDVQNNMLNWLGVLNIFCYF